MLKISISCTRFKTNYSSFTRRSSAAPVEALNKKERQGETQFATKTEVPPPLNVNVFYFFESHPIYDQTEGCSVVFVTLYNFTIYL
jgi:hypothetical protein